MFPSIGQSVDDDFIRLFKKSALNIVDICEESFRIINLVEINDANMEPLNSRFENNYKFCVSSITEICINAIKNGYKAAREICENEYLPLARQKFDKHYEIFYLRSQNLLKEKEIAELKKNKEPKFVQKCKRVNNYGHDSDGDAVVVKSKECWMEEVLTREERLERAKDRPGYKIGQAIRNLFTKD